MATRSTRFLVLFSLLILFSIPVLSQTSDRRQTNPEAKAQEQPSSLPPNANSTDIVANEIGQLRKTVQTLNARLREVIDKFLSPDADKSSAAIYKLNRLSLNLDLLTRAEQRAEMMRKQLMEMMEKETALKSRLLQVEEDMRPENIERSMNMIGTTRTSELRETRRRILETDRRGIEGLLRETTQNRQRLEDDVRQADALVSRIRQRLLPLIEDEIEKISPN